MGAPADKLRRSLGIPVRLPLPNFRSLLDRYNNSWCPESVALLLSLGCAVGIADILVYYNGKPSPKIAGLTLNAVIATLGAASKAFLIFAVSNSLGQLKWVWFTGDGQSPRSLLDAEVFDDASRGPLGAFKMLLAGTRRSAASLGALLIILALAFDPFIQLVIDYETSTQFLDSTLALYNRAGLYQLNPTASSSVYALNSAFWCDDFVWPAPECSTGKCHWDNFTTLAWEAKCYEDRNWTLSADCNLIFPIEDSITDSGQNDNQFQITRNCSVLRSHSPYPTASSVVEAYISLAVTEGFGWLDVPTAFTAVTYNSANDWASKSDRYTFLCPPGQDVTSPFAMISTFDLHMDSDWIMALRSVTTCELDLFLHTYSLDSTGTSVSADLQHRQSLRKAAGLSQDPDYELSHRVCLRPDSEPIEAWFSNRSQGLSSSSNDLEYCLSPDDNTLLGWGSALTMLAGQRNTSLQKFEVLYGLVNTTNVMMDLNSGDTDAYIGPYGSILNQSTSDSFNIWIDQGPDRVMKNVAAVMTKLGLDASLNVNGTDPVYGQIGEAVTLVRVRWLWLILPYGLCAAGFLFLFLTVHLSYQASAPLWKSSINALFYHGIDYDYGTFEQLSTLAEMNDQAARTKALLRPCGTFRKLMLDTTVERRQLSQDDDHDD